MIRWGELLRLGIVAEHHAFVLQSKSRYNALGPCTGLYVESVHFPHRIMYYSFFYADELVVWGE